jgi:hypothetical protein
MSYLRGPLTKDQIEILMKDAPEREHTQVVAESASGGAATVGQATGVEAPAPAPAAPSTTDAPAASSAQTTATPGERAPTVASGVATYFLDPAAPWAASVGAVAGGTRLQAALAARVHLRYDDAKAGLDELEEWEAIYFPAPARFAPEAGRTVDFDDRDFRADPPPTASFIAPEAPLAEESFFKDAASGLKGYLLRNRSVTVFRNAALKLFSRVGESKEAFVARCDQAAQQAADAETAKIRDRLELRKDRLQLALDTANRQLEQARTEQKTRGQQELVAGAGSILSVLLGGKANTRTIARAGRSLGGIATRRGMAERARVRVEVAQRKVQERQQDLAELEHEILTEVQEIDQRWQLEAGRVEELQVGLESTDVDVERIAVVWVPTA